MAELPLQSAAEKNPVICLYGPTATGKTDIAVELVRKFACEIISVDSALIYRGMDIGTAKPSGEVLAAAPHRLINICDPTESYSVAKFRKDAMKAIEEIHSSGKIPLLVGGTMLYFRALLEGLSPLPTSVPELRQELEALVSQRGLQSMHSRLKEVDPEAACRIHPHDPQRIIRALEVFELAGKPMTELQKIKMPVLGDICRVRTYGLMPVARAQLHARIALRFERMLAQGFLGEVEQLMSLKGIHEGLPSMRAVGYRQAYQYLMGRLGHDEMIEKAVVATRQLAKRQITWMRSSTTHVEFDPFEVSRDTLVGSILEDIEMSKTFKKA